MIVDGVGSVALVKTGSGTLTLDRRQQLHGGTTISGGTLGDHQMPATWAAAGSVTIGAATLANHRRGGLGQRAFN